jgi:L-amino acid N-acyltransferase YncA
MENEEHSVRVFARVVQLEKRGQIVGDRSAGAVREAKHYVYLVVFSSYTARMSGLGLNSSP